MVLGKKSPVTAVMVGAGFRGREVYGKYAVMNPEKIKFVAVAEPDEFRRRQFQAEHGINDQMAFSSWDAMFEYKTGKLADAAFICTQDNMHFEPCVKAMEAGYDIVLEKPISPIPEECRRIVQSARQTGRFVQVCHVLRFTDFWKKVKQLVEQGRIGRVIHYDHSENVSYWHFGHSYVRGNYRNKETASPLILAKTCHDLDLMHWIIGENPAAVQSTGELSHYCPANAPEGAPERCTDGCPASADCPWYAPRLYVTAEPLLRIGLHAPSVWTRAMAGFVLSHRGLARLFSLFDKRLKGVLDWDRFPASVITTDLSAEGKIRALEEGPYGLCIYRCGNDVVDHQVSTYTFPGGVTGTLTVHGVSDLEGREIRIFGTRGVIRGYFRYNGEQITFTDFRHSKTELVHKAGLSLGGHGGGDFGLMDSFVRVMREEASPEEAGTTHIEGAMESHYMAFAAEEARINSITVDVGQYRML